MEAALVQRKYAADDEIVQHGDVIVVADAVSTAEAEKLQRLLD